MMWVANEKTGLVHAEDCDYAQQIFMDRVEFDELYHALSDGYCEAGCCLTDRPYSEILLANEKQKASRMRVIGDGGCGVCGEDRCTQLAHVVPRTLGGCVTLPLCPTHHKAYDEGCLTQDELDILSRFASGRISPKAGSDVHKMHGAVRREREAV